MNRDLHFDNRSSLRIGLCVVVALLRLGSAGAAEPLRAEALIEEREIFAGDTVGFQIHVFGSNKPERPDLSRLAGWTVAAAGEQDYSSHETVIVNGKLTRNVTRRYVFQYRLTPKRAGNFVVPPIEIRAQGQTARTKPIMIAVKQPQESEDTKLRCRVSRRDCYVGEAVSLTVTWFIAKNVRGYQFTLPVLDMAEFEVLTPDVKRDPHRSYHRIPLGDIETLGVQGKGRLDGREYTTITFGLILMPTKPGRFTIPRGTVACEVLSGYRRPRSPFDDFFGRGGREVYKKVVVPSNPLALEVLALPKKGKPVNFAGHVGHYRILAGAGPLEVSVGDPITLTLTVTGSDYPAGVRIPPLAGQEALARDFKIPKEMAPGRVQGKSKIFTQTIRALRADVTQIPPIELSYFDTEAGEYRLAQSTAIPLTVHATRVITVQDAEGTEIVSAGSALEAWSKGIAYNYEGPDVLRDQQRGPATWIRSPLWIVLLGGPPFLFLALFAGVTAVRRRHADPLAARARGAFTRLRAALRAARANSAPQTQYEQLLRAFTDYLSERLRMPSGTLTFQDAGPVLHERGVDDETLAAVADVFRACEEGRYAGAAHDTNVTDTLPAQIEGLGRRLERVLR